VNDAHPTFAAAVAIPDVDHGRRLGVLDGWRGISILSVLACHFLPLGPKSWDLNRAAGPFGMAIFFTLSGFLITSNLLKNPNVRVFFIRRACRILPLAFLYFAVVLIWQRKPLADFAAYYLFQINYRTEFITDLTSPLWSLCIEVHFYLFVGLLVAACGKRGLLVLPLIGVVLTGVRMAGGNRFSLQTHLRVDEILAGAAVALVHASAGRSHIRRLVATPHPLIWMAFFVVCCHQLGGDLAYLRPYAGAGMVASTLWRRGTPSRILLSRTLKYVAEISYALYVLHPLMTVGWFVSGGKWELYLLKRPVGFLMTLTLAHISTFQYEHRWIALGKKWSARAR
jgi:peptidoglycan/LPS O-acetylase OafA/YrhL